MNPILSLYRFSVTAEVPVIGVSIISQTVHMSGQARENDREIQSSESAW